MREKEFGKLFKRGKMLSWRLLDSAVPNKCVHSDGNKNMEYKFN